MAKAVLGPQAWTEPQLPRTQEQFLRAMAPRMPWYLRPPDALSGASLNDFMREAHDRMVKVLNPGNQPSFLLDPFLKNLDQKKRRFLLHLEYTALRTSIMSLVDPAKKDKEDWLRTELQIIHANGGFSADMPHHPLYNDYRGTMYESRGAPMRKFSIDAQDKALALHILGEHTGDVADLFPEMSRRSPGMRINEYAVSMRRKLGVLLDGFEMQLDDRIGKDDMDRLIDVVIDEWMTMTQTMGLEEKARAAAVRLNCERAFQELNLDTLLEAVNPESLRTVEQEERVNPLIQYLAVHLSTETENAEQLLRLATTWGKKIYTFGIPACDRPAQCIATFLSLLRCEDITIEDIRKGHIA